MSVPGNINTAPPPSSFDDNTEFYEESRWAKLKRHLLEEPLIPLGCGLTVWALYEATKSMKTGDKYKTNRMFRRRIYAQGFTILAMVAGSVYWESDRAKRRQFDGLLEEKKKKEKHEAWLKELEAREEEEQELRKMRDRLMKGRNTEKQRLAGDEKRAIEAENKEAAGQPKGGLGTVVPSGEADEKRSTSVLSAVSSIWPGKKS